MLDDPGGDLRAGAQLEPGENVFYVHPGRARTDDQPFGNFAVSESLGDEDGHLALAWREPVNLPVFPWR